MAQTVRVFQVSRLRGWLLAIIACVPATQAVGVQGGDPCPILPLRIQIVLGEGASIDDVNLDFGTTTADSLPPSYLLEIPVGADEATFAALVALDPRVVAAEVAFRTESPEGVRQMVAGAVGGTIADFVDQGFTDRLHLDEAHAHLDGDGARVAVLDTGVNATHEALAGPLLLSGYDFVDSDTDPSEEANGVDDDGDESIDEGAGHGTMVAGLVRLIAPETEILPIRVLDDEGRGSVFDVAKGIRHAVDGGATVINLSLGLVCESEILRREIDAAIGAGTSIVAAAGNDDTEEPPFYPASEPLVVSVTALDSLDVKADFANYHVSVDLSAPGVGILAPYIDGAYALGAGTSFAAPMVAGQLALIRGYHSWLSRAEVDSLAGLGVVAIDDIPGNEPYAGRLGSGRIDLLATLEALEAVVAVSILEPPRERLRMRPSPVGIGMSVAIASIDASTTWVDVHDLAGRRLRRLDPSGENATSWDLRDDAGRLVSPGLYVLRAWSRAGGGAPTLGRIVVVP